MFFNLFKKSGQDQEQKQAFEDKPPKPVESAPAVAVKHKPVSLPLEFLSRLIPIGKLPTEALEKLPLHAATFAPGATIFKQGTYNDSLIYLVKGIVYLEAPNGSGQEITTGTLKALCPLTFGAKHQLTAFAKSEVMVIYVGSDQVSGKPKPRANFLADPELAPPVLKTNAFFKLFCRFYQSGNLVIPSLPSVAVKLRTAMQGDIGINEAVKIISLDPAITAKLIQISNGALYQTTVPSTSCLAAVSRLGLSTTRTIVTSISLRHLFSSQQPEVNKRVQNIWKQSLRVSSISQVLAGLTKAATPDQALLAGLVHNIGLLPILKFAETLKPDQFKLTDLDSCLPLIQAQLGSMILSDWGFPESLVNIPLEVEDWFHYESNKLDLTDIVLLAKYHSLLANNSNTELPLLSTLPAYQKLGNNSLSPDMSLQVLQDAKQQIAEAMALFTG